jgi:Cu(I)/Ag(I) efflux system protein CusF
VKRWLCVMVLIAIACGARDVAEGEAIVRAVDVAANRITVDHGDLPGMMKAMRMDFDVADPALLTGLAPGDEIKIEVRHADGRYTLTKIEKQPAS